MRCSGLLVLGLVGAVCAIAPRAAAGEPLPIYPVGADEAPAASAGNVPRPRFDDHPLALELRTGVAAATGMLGLVLEYNVHDRLALNAGVGTNLLGISSSIGARVRPLIVASSNHAQLHALILEASLSRSAYTGHWAGDVLCEDDCPQPRYVAWAQAEVGWEARFGHWQIQISLGAAALLGNPQFSCALGQAEPRDCEGTTSRMLITQTLGVGYAF